VKLKFGIRYNSGSVLFGILMSGVAFGGFSRWWLILAAISLLDTGPTYIWRNDGSGWRRRFERRSALNAKGE